MGTGQNLRSELCHMSKTNRTMAYGNSRSLELEIKRRSTQNNFCADCQARIRMCNTAHVSSFW